MEYAITVFDNVNTEQVLKNVKKIIELKNGNTNIGNNIETYLKKVKEILNKISVHNYKELCKDICEIKLIENNNEQLDKLSDMLFEQILNDDNGTFLNLYCEILKELSLKYENLKIFTLKKIGKYVLYNHSINVPKTLINEIDVQDYKIKKKSNYLCCLQFIITMYNSNYIDINSIEMTIDNLFVNVLENKYSELYIDYLCFFFLELLKKSPFRNRKDEKMKNWLTKFYVIMNHYKDNNLTKRIIYKIEDLFELCNQTIIDEILFS